MRKSSAVEEKGKPAGEIRSLQGLARVLKDRDKLFALFYATWCPFCVSFLPVFRERAEKDPRLFVEVKDDRETIADEYSVEVYPTVLFFANGAVSKRLDGVLGIGLSRKDFLKFVTSCLRGL